MKNKVFNKKMKKRNKEKIPMMIVKIVRILKLCYQELEKDNNPLAMVLMPVLPELPATRFLVVGMQ